jgi:intraflagellar transport protein 122
MKAQLLAYNGQYQEAAKAFSRAGQPERAIELFADLRDWEQAKIYAGGTDKVDTRDLVRRQAEWAEEVKDWRGAADMFNTSGEHERAVRIIGENQYEGWDEQLIGIVRNLPNSDKTALSLAAEYLANGQSDAFAREAFEKLQDYTKLMALYIKRQDWEAAVKLSENHAGKFDQSIFLPYAEWLTLRDRYEEALTVYRKAGRPDRSHHIMKQLTYNAVVERRFKDAAYVFEGAAAATPTCCYARPRDFYRTALTHTSPISRYYYWLLAQESLHVADMSKEPITADQVKEQAAYLLKADVCYVYQNIEDFFLPFTSLQPEVLFQSARFLLNALGTSDAPHGVSRVKILCTLAKMAKQLGAFKLAQTVYHQLQHLKLPEAWQEQVDIDTLTIQAKSTFSDSQELLPICYRCGTSNPLLNPFTSAFSHGDVCTNCGHPFVRSFVTLDILPLVEFVPADTDASGKDLTDEVAVQLLRMAPDASGKPRKGKGRNWSEGTSGGANVMTLDDDGDGGGAMGGMGGGGGGGGEDVFQKAVQQTLDRQQGASSYRPVLCDEDTLSQMRREEVFVIHSTHKGIRSRFYKNVLEGVPVALSQPAQRFFHEEELEAAILKDGKCPYSRAAVAGADYGSL